MSPAPLDTSFSAIVERLLEKLGPGTDIHPGSMARTLTEAYARELATFYAMLEHAHRSGYLETAEGAALNHVVAVLGLTRARAGRLVGAVEFSRNSPAPEDIGIPAGRQVTGLAEAGDSASKARSLPLFETLEDAVLRRGEMRVTVRVQQLQEDAESSRKAPAIINPGGLTSMPRPILGIESVTNPAPIRRTGEDETDESLRARARTSPRDGEAGTFEAIAAAVRQQGVRKVTVREPPDALPGIVEVLVGDADFAEDPQAVERVRRAILASKAAGIQVRLDYARTVYFEVEFQVEPENPELDGSAFDRMRRELQQALVRFTQGLRVGEPVSRRKLEAVLFANPAVRQISELRVATFVRRLATRDARPPTLVPEPESREFGPARDWRLSPQETATIDLELRPPRITRLRPVVFRLDLVVSRERADPRTAEQVRQALRGAVLLFTARLATATPPLRARTLWKTLQDTLVEQAGVKGVLSALLVRNDGLAFTLTDREEPVGWVSGVQVVLGETELVLQE